METYSRFITELKNNEIFVFGSNLSGFHGAGAAGYASFGVTGNQWRKFEYDQKPYGWKGKWNRKGYYRGLQRGLEGWSYALPTVQSPGNALPTKKITTEILELYNTARVNSDWRFLIAYNTNNKNLNGYTPSEMAKMFAQKFIPDNIIFENNFAKLVQQHFEKM